MAPIEPHLHNSNILPYTLLTTYILTTTALTTLILRALNTAYHSLPPSASVRNRRAHRIHHVEFFSLLAFISLLSALFFNAHTLTLSQRVWALERSPGPLHVLRENVFSSSSTPTQWGRWLRETDLLSEFHEIVFERARRRWWGQQLLMGGVPWSAFVVTEGSYRRIPHLWAFVALAPLVSLPFAQALFFLAMLWTPVPLRRGGARRDVDLEHPLFFIAMAVTAVGVALLPFTTGTTAFRGTMIALGWAYLAPLAAPFLAHAEHDDKHGKKTSGSKSNSYSTFAFYRFSAALALLTHLSYLSIALLDHSDPHAYWNRHSSILHHDRTSAPPAWKQAQSGVAKILNAATDHPSVSKAAADCVLAAIGMFAWAYFRGTRVRELLSSVALWGEWPEEALAAVAEESEKVAAKAKKGALAAGEVVERNTGSRRSLGRAWRRSHADEADGFEAHGEKDADYRPSSKEITSGDDDREEKGATAALSWGLSAVGGLAYVTAGTLGAEVAA